MLYKEYRNEIKSGDLLVWSTDDFSKWPNWFSAIIRIFTMSEYNHVGIAWVIGNRVFVIEATPPAVRIYPLSHKPSFYHMPMDLEWDTDMEDWLLEQVGKPYSVIDAIRGYFGKPKRDGKWMCSELAGTFYRKCGYNLKDSWTPEELVRYFREEESRSMKFVKTSDF